MQEIIMKNNENGHMARLTLMGNRTVKFEYKEECFGDVRTRIYEHANIIHMVREGRKNGFEVVAVHNK